MISIAPSAFIRGIDVEYLFSIMCRQKNMNDCGIETKL